MLRKRRKEMRKAETEKKGRGERLSGRKDDNVKRRVWVCLKMGRQELGGKGPGLAWVIPHIPADSQGKRCS